MLYQNHAVRCELADGIAVVTIDIPPVNQLCAEAIDGLRDSFHALENENTLRCVIVTGGGEKAFVAGADIKEFPSWTPDMAEELTEKGQRVFSQIENFKTPVIAAINGFALGGGLELALACDIRFASTNAKMGLPEVSLGIIPGYGGTQRLCRTINVGDAKRLIYTAGKIGAEKALQLGLIQEIYPQEELMERTMDVAKKIAANGPVAIRATKRCINFERNGSIQNGLYTELMAAREVFTSQDHLEGVNAFIEKRPAKFKNN